MSVFRITDGAARICTLIPLFFTSLVTSIHTGARSNRHCETERLGVPERIGALNLWLYMGSNPGRLCSRGVLYPLHYAPGARVSQHIKGPLWVISLWSTAFQPNLVWHYLTTVAMLKCRYIIHGRHEKSPKEESPKTKSPTYYKKSYMQKVLMLKQSTKIFFKLFF